MKHVLESCRSSEILWSYASVLFWIIAVAIENDIPFEDLIPKFNRKISIITEKRVWVILLISNDLAELVKACANSYTVTIFSRFCCANIYSRKHHNKLANKHIDAYFQQAEVIEMERLGLQRLQIHCHQWRLCSAFSRNEVRVNKPQYILAELLNPFLPVPGTQSAIQNYPTSSNGFCKHSIWTSAWSMLPSPNPLLTRNP